MKRPTVVIGLALGDEGKGSIVDYLTRTRNVSTVVRFNGGAQAGHNVISPDGKHHLFSQFGAGTLVGRTKTHLAYTMLIDPPALMAEAGHLQSLGCQNLFDRLTIDEDAIVVTPFHKAGNRIREVLRGAGHHGSCGMGIGETMADNLAHPNEIIRMRDLRMRDLRDLTSVTRKLKRIQERKKAEFQHYFALFKRDPRAFEANVEVLTDIDAPDLIAERFCAIARQVIIVPRSYLRELGNGPGELVFEGAQGVLLDQTYGFHPYTTWSTTTFANALHLLAEAGYDEPPFCLGVLRAYFTRHGAGPFPTEDPALQLGDSYNGTGAWQGAFRHGWFDAVLARYAIAVAGGVDAVAITNLDRLPSVGRQYCDRYRPRFSSGMTVSQLFPQPTLDRQAQLTQELQEVTPVYANAPAWNSGYLDRLSDAIGAPIGLVSMGPTAHGKYCVQREEIAWVE